MKTIKYLYIPLLLSLILLSCSREEPYVAPTTPVVTNPAKVVINEIAPNESPDWLEIYNTDATQTADISGYKYVNVTKSTDASKLYATYTFPSGTTIAPKGYLALDCDGTATTSREKLSSTNGEKLSLLDSKGAVVDSITFPAAIAVGSSYARVPDGSTWKVTTTLTKGVTNK
jgi:hypothetical protein